MLSYGMEFKAFVKSIFYAEIYTFKVMVKVSKFIALYKRDLFYNLN